MKEGKILTEVSRLLHGIAAATLLPFAAYCVPAAAAPERASGVFGNSTHTSSPVLIPVSADPARGALQSGRIIVFAKKLEDPLQPDRQVNFNDFTPSATSIAAREVNDVRAGTVVLIDAETDGFPAPFSTLEPGTYEVQAVLDRNHDYAYSGRGAGDLVSKVVTVTLPGSIPELNLDTEIRARDETEAAADNVPGEYRTEILEWLPKLKAIDFQSAVMTAFRGSPSFIRGWVALPPGYDGSRKFPTAYSDGGFGSSLISAKAKAAAAMADMALGKSPPMIWVFLDHSSGTGVHEFADSANNGPWGTALATELIPALERQYAMDAKPSGPVLDRPQFGRLVLTVAAGPLSQGVRRQLANLARSKRFPCFSRYRPVWSQREFLS